MNQDRCHPTILEPFVHACKKVLSFNNFDIGPIHSGRWSHRLYQGGLRLDAQTRDHKEMVNSAIEQMTLIIFTIVKNNHLSK